MTKRITEKKTTSTRVAAKKTRRNVPLCLRIEDDAELRSFAPISIGGNNDSRPSVTRLVVGLIPILRVAHSVAGREGLAAALAEGLALRLRARGALKRGKTIDAAPLTLEERARLLPGPTAYAIRDAWEKGDRDRERASSILGGILAEDLTAALRHLPELDAELRAMPPIGAAS